jgi:hypothetical protein
MQHTFTRCQCIYEFEQAYSITFLKESIYGITSDTREIGLIFQPTINSKGV